MKPNYWMLSLALAAFIGLNLPAHAAEDSGPAVTLQIESQPLRDALGEFGRQSGLQVIFIQTDVGAAMVAPRVAGSYSARAALDRLLADTGLRYEFINARTVAIRARGTGDGVKPLAEVTNSGGAGMRMEEGKAQEGKPEPTAGAPSGDKLEEIVVTAQKRTERLIDVPISIAALSGDDLQKRGVISILDLPSVVPDLAIYNTGPARSFEIRGISNFGGSSSALVGLYLDEADVTVNSGTAIDVSSLYDLERIEVLRGPQGTLYGDGSAGGTIHFITKNPVLNHFATSSDVTASFTESGAPSGQINAMLNLPLVSEVLGLRVVGTVRRDGGWIDQPAADAKDINGTDLSGLRAKGLWQPNSQLKLSAMADISRSDSGTGTGEDAKGNYTQAFNLTTMPRVELDHDLYNLTLTYDFSSVQLLNTSTYLKESNDSRNLAGVTPSSPYQFYIPRLFFSERVWSDELRLTSIGSGRWKWTTGVFYRHDQSGLDEPHYYNGPAGLLPPSFDPYISSGRSSSWSVFGDTSYGLTDRLTIGAGARYFRDSQEFDTNFQSNVQAGIFHSVDPRAYVHFKLADGINVYASAAKGFRSGGFNFPDPSTPSTFDPETIWTYEFGVKMSLLAGRLDLDAAFFHTNYSDYQSFGAVNQLGTPAFYNAGDARIRGAEWNMNWRPTDLWQLTVSGDYLHARYTAINLTGAFHNVGDELDFVPKYQFTTSVQRGFKWREQSGFARLDYSVQGPQVLRNRAFFVPGVLGRTDVIRSLSLRAGLQLNDNLKWAVFGQNLLNDRGFLNPDYLEGYSPRSRPRTYGIEFNVAFD